MANQFMLLLLLPCFVSGAVYIGGDGDVSVEAKRNLHISAGRNITVNGKPLDACTYCDRLAALEVKLERLINENQITTPSSAPTTEPTSTPETVPRNCKGVYKSGNHRSGVYAIDTHDGLGAFKVYCDMTIDEGGWTVFQRRKDGSEDFLRRWDDYKTGFGDLKGEFWLGLDKIHRLTSTNQVLRIDMEDFENNKRYAQYATFSVGHENGKYNLSIAQYSGDAGDSMSRQNGMNFSTYLDNVTWNGDCADLDSGGWWYRQCPNSNLNGLYKDSSYDKLAN